MCDPAAGFQLRMYNLKQGIEELFIQCALLHMIVYGSNFCDVRDTLNVCRGRNLLYQCVYEHIMACSELKQPNAFFSFLLVRKNYCPVQVSIIPIILNQSQGKMDSCVGSTNYT